MPGYTNPRTEMLLHEQATTAAAATTGNTYYCFKAPAACQVTEVNMNSNGDIGAGTIQVLVKNGSATIVNHGTATAFTGGTWTTETLVTPAIADGETITVVIIGDGTLDCTLTVQATMVYGYPAAQG